MLISLIVPVYNKIHYLASTLDAIQRQTFRDYECILIDDGSTDGSGSICDDFAFKDARFKVFHIPNGGVSHARNVGLDYARGKYITFIDGDDSFHVDYLKNLYDCITKSNADLVIGSSLKVWDSSELQVPIQVPFSGLKATAEVMPFFARDQLATGIYGYCWGKLLKSSLINFLRFNEEIRLAEDFDFNLRLFPRVQTIYFDDKPYYYYLQAAENSSALTPDDRIDYLAQLRINLHYRDFLKQMKVYAGQNQKILEEHISNYLYFSMFYCPTAQFSERFAQLRSICENEGLVPHGDKGLQKWLLFWLRKGICFIPKCTMRLYRSVRDMLR